jgi:hypothetical protein
MRHFRLKKKTLRVIEFLVIGVLFGLIEDIIAVKAVSNAVIDLRVVGTILFIAIPFAMISELIVDHPRFWTILKLKREERTPDTTAYDKQKNMQSSNSHPTA